MTEVYFSSDVWMTVVIIYGEIEKALMTLAWLHSWWRFKIEKGDDKYGGPPGSEVQQNNIGRQFATMISVFSEVWTACAWFGRHGKQTSNRKLPISLLDNFSKCQLKLPVYTVAYELQVWIWTVYWHISSRVLWSVDDRWINHWRTTLGRVKDPRIVRNVTMRMIARHRQSILLIVNLHQAFTALLDQCLRRGNASCMSV